MPHALLLKTDEVLDTAVIGGGQAGLACGFYLLRHKLNFRIFDADDTPGGSWQHMWPSLTLFSPANASNLPGWPMPHYDGFPPASHVVDYLTRYEQRYDLPVIRPARVEQVTHSDGIFSLSLAHTPTPVRARTVIAATGTWTAPFVPHYPGHFAGKQWHAATYPGPQEFRGTRVAVVGAANSGAQIAADLLNSAAPADVTWFTRNPPHYMPDDVDGRALFKRSRARLLAMQSGKRDPGPESQLGDIVMVPPVKRARDAGKLSATPMFASLDELNATETTTDKHPGFDHLIWCTGFRPALGPLRGLLTADPNPDGYLVAQVPGLHLVGYGTWTGPGSATLAGVSPFARGVAQTIAESLKP